MKDVNKQLKWDIRFLSLAHEVATWSKDPSTQVGACIAKGKKFMSIGFNGPPAKVKDSATMSREKKLARTIHAEPNAIFAARGNLKKCTLYATHFPCSHCAAVIIQKKIKRVVCPPATPDMLSRWADSMKEAIEMFQEAGVTLVEIPLSMLPCAK